VLNSTSSSKPWILRGVSWKLMTLWTRPLRPKPGVWMAPMGQLSETDVPGVGVVVLAYNVGAILRMGMWFGHGSSYHLWLP